MRSRVRPFEIIFPFFDCIELFRIHTRPVSPLVDKLIGERFTEVIILHRAVINAWVEIERILRHSGGIKNVSGDEMILIEVDLLSAFIAYHEDLITVVIITYIIADYTVKIIGQKDAIAAGADTGVELYNTLAVLLKKFGSDAVRYVAPGT